MDEKQIILTSIASAIACNCIPCYEHYWLKAKKAGICETNLNEAIAIGEKVKSGAAMAIRNTVDVIQRGEIPEEELGQNTPCVCGS
jgi:hypothetical protein